MSNQLEQQIFDTQIPFEQRALAVFDYQYHHNSIYRDFCNYLNRKPTGISRLEQIPFIPIELFKSHRIISDEKEAERIFRSSGTTGQVTSQHVVADCNIYDQSIQQGIEKFFGPLNQYCVLALLPSYLERQDASLVYMADYMMQVSSHPYNGFYLDNFSELKNRIIQLQDQQQPTLLLGVTFALLDFAEQYPMDLAGIKLIETGGMKGRRKELTRNELHHQLKSAFQLDQIYSEYGMTEMLSQAYFTENQLFYPSDTLKILIREINDPLNYLNNGESGAINVIDLANLYSCSFIATQDIGQAFQDGGFQVLGRTDNSDLRGCNLMIS